MVVTNDADLAARIRRLRHHGQTSAGVHAEVVYNSRLDEIQAAVLRVKLRHLDEWIAARRERAHLYTQLLLGRGVEPPFEVPGTSGSYYLYTIRSPRRDAIQAGLADSGIEARVYYPSPLYRQPAIRGVTSALDSPHPSPGAEQACREILSLQLYPELPLAAVRQVATAVLALAQAPPEKKC